MIIDGHSHVTLPVEEHIQQMNRAGIDKTILFSTTFHPELAENTKELKEKMKYLSDLLEGKKGSKYEGMVGALKVKWKDGKTINVSGMTDYKRKLWWDKPEEIIGKIIEIRGMMDSTKGSIIQPRFKSIRHDKTEGDF